MDGKTFQKRKEDFVCENCGREVTGDGYTNHCPHCLWSKHVDVYPGDRAETCGGLMKPVAIEGPTSAYQIVHLCVTCGEKRKNKLAIADNLDEVIALASNPLQEIV